MRAIDADVLKRHIDKLPALPDGNFAGNHSALKALINMQPTIEPSTNNSEIPNSSDTISRQTVKEKSMTKEEIIHRLQYARYRIDNVTYAPDVLKAIDIAIEAVGNTDSDTISRQAAIETVMDCYDNAELFEVYEEKLRELPPAQPEPIRINLNEPIKVKLTDWGKEIYYHQYDKANQIAGREICKPKFPEEDENGYTEIQLWCFVELYGEHMGMTLPNVIEPLEIVYERRTG